MLVVDLLSILPGQEKLIRDVFQSYWDFQARWIERMPGYAHDMISCMMVPGKMDWISSPAYSQIPILAWGLERVYRRNGEKELLQQCLKPLERFHEWYWRERDVTDIGLVAVGPHHGRPANGGPVPVGETRHAGEDSRWHNRRLDSVDRGCFNQSHG
jgi:hypothetical protein